MRRFGVYDDFGWPFGDWATWTMTPGKIYDPEKYDLVEKESYKKNLIAQKEKDIGRLEESIKELKEEIKRLKA